MINNNIKKISIQSSLISIKAGELYTSYKTIFLQNFRTLCLTISVKQGCKNRIELHFLVHHLDYKLSQVLFCISYITYMGLL